MGSSVEMWPVLSYKTGLRIPPRINSPEHIKSILTEALANKTSDVYIQPGKPIMADINGEKHALMQQALDTEEVRRILSIICNRDSAATDISAGRAVNTRYDMLISGKDDADLSIGTRHRFRVNASPISFGTETSCQIVMRTIPADPPSVDAIGLTPEILEGATPENGIVLIAGATGSGKTTTFASMIVYVLFNDTPIKGSIITYEDPIEYAINDHGSKHSFIVQSQIPEQFPSFAAGIREAMRRKPALILIGEMRDQESISAAMEAARTGHTVYSTVHATDVSAICYRIVSRYQESQHQTVSFDFVDSTRFLMAQRLVKCKAGGRIAVREYLRFDREVRDTLFALKSINPIAVTQVVREFVNKQGHSFQAEGKRLLEEGVIDESVAMQLMRT